MKGAETMVNFEENLKKLNIDLDQYINKNIKKRRIASAQRVGNLLFVSGNGPLDNQGKPIITGRLGENLTVEEGYEAAKLAGLNLLARIKEEIGDLNKVKQIVKVLGFVSSADNFHEQPAVMHGFTDLMGDVFGDEVGFHARSAIGTNTLPMNIPVEIEMIIELNAE